MAHARKVQELRVAAPNAVGLLAKVAAAVSSAGVDITAICGYEVGDTGYIMLAVDDNNKALGALRAVGYDVSENEVVLVDLENRVGTGAEAASKLAAAGIDIRYCYATAGGGELALMVLATDDNGKAVEILS